MEDARRVDDARGPKRTAALLLLLLLGDFAPHELVPLARAFAIASPGVSWHGRLYDAIGKVALPQLAAFSAQELAN